MKKKNNPGDKRIAVAFILDGHIVSNDLLTFNRIKQALEKTFPAAQIEDLKLMSLINQNTDNI